MSHGEPPTPPIGRFAPSPTGDLHFGSLAAAVASLLQARHAGGQWLIRIDDIDPPREVAGSADRILAELGRFGMCSDQPVLYQNTRGAAYQSAINELIGKNLAYWCGCSRASLPPSGIYPGTCRSGLLPGMKPRAIRVRAPSAAIRFEDRVQGPVEEDLRSTVGDFVIRRADGLAAYQLAAAVDDAFQQVTEVVRGADLLSSTARQIYLQRCLGLPSPRYAHHAVATGPAGEKLSKRLGSDPLSRWPAERALAGVLRFLGQPCPPGMSLDENWRWALQNWSLANVPRLRSAPAEAIDGVSTGVRG